MGLDNIFCVDLQQPSLTQVPLWHSTATLSSLRSSSLLLLSPASSSSFVVVIIVVVVFVVVLTRLCHRYIAIKPVLWCQCCNSITMLLVFVHYTLSLIVLVCPRRPVFAMITDAIGSGQMTGMTHKKWICV